MPTHGALSKAGKMRGKVGHQRKWREGRRSKTNRPFYGKKHKIPRIRNRLNYEKMLRGLR